MFLGKNEAKLSPVRKELVLLEEVVDDVAEVLVPLLSVVCVARVALQQLGGPGPEVVGVPPRPVPESGKCNLPKKFGV